MVEQFFDGGYCQDMPPSHALVYLCLCRHARDGVAIITKFDLMEHTGLSNECIRRAGNYLESHGYVAKRQTGGKKPNSYRLLDLGKVKRSA